MIVVAVSFLRNFPSTGGAVCLYALVYTLEAYRRNQYSSVEARAGLLVRFG